MLPCLILSDDDPNCDMVLKRTPLPGQVSRVVPVAQNENMFVVTQVGSVISVQQFDRNCGPLGGTRQVFASEDFWDDEGGLSDASPIGENLVVTWVLSGDVWLTLMPGVSGGPLMLPTRVNAPSDKFQHRRQVAVAGNGDDKFIVSWSSWQQDGSDWGVFARGFWSNGTAAGEEMQVNDFTEFFQWRSQLSWCQGQPWILWSNSSGTVCVGESSPPDCGTGPMMKDLRGLFPSEANTSSELLTKEIELPGTQPLGAALACQDPTKSHSALAVWLDHAGQTLVTQLVQPGKAGYKDLQDRSLPPVFLQFGSQPPPLLSHSSDRKKEEAAVKILPGPLLGGASRDQGGLMLVASSQYTLMIASDDNGEVAAQLFKYSYDSSIGQMSAMEPAPPRHMASGVANFRAVWQTGPIGNQSWSKQDQAIILCFADGLGIGGGPSFRCSRRRIPWLAGTEGLEGWSLGLCLALSMMLLLLVVFCVIRICGYRRFVRPANETAEQAAAARTRLRELREQLSTIPEAPPEPLVARVSSSSQDLAAVRAASSTSPEALAATENTASPGLCSICHNEVSIRVAFRPCGHTACRDCGTRTMQANDQCHVCHAAIEGVQPVYI